MSVRRSILVIAVSLVVTVLVSPAVAGAFATVGPPPLYSSVSGLPDGRVYEQVSPSNKHGYSAAWLGRLVIGSASADGESLMYVGNGALAEPAAVSGVFGLTVARRSLSGWRNRGVLSRGVRTPEGAVGAEENNNFTKQTPAWFTFSGDFSNMAYSKPGADVVAPDVTGSPENVYLKGEDPLVEPLWIGRPQTSEPVYQRQEGAQVSLPGGANSDLSAVYFAMEPELLPPDAVRRGRHTYGVYEYREGVLREAGLMPDGTVNPFGALPAGVAAVPPVHNDNSPNQMGNQVSEDGTRLFFVSPEEFYSKYSPSCGECSSEATELYVRERSADGSSKTILVSQSQVSGHLGEPSPHGPLAVKGTLRETTETAQEAFNHSASGPPMFAYASPDGSHVFFQSIDRLTDAATEDGQPKVYDFDLLTKVLTYLPEVAGTIVTVAKDGSSFLFEDTSHSPVELDLWHRGATGGAITKVAQLSAPEMTCPVFKENELPEAGQTLVPGQDPVCVGPARVSDDGFVYVFAAGAAIPGFNDGGAFEQIFRYDATVGELTCVSCPPSGVTPSGEALMSTVDLTTPQGSSPIVYPQPLNADRGMSTGGSRVFFDTPAPLVPQDVNGVRDVYEWENGTVYLLSSGSGVDDAKFVDNSRSGDDVFIAATNELVPGDNDEAYDVYDTRVPRPGDSVPPKGVPCQGDVCQGPPSVPQLLTLPASAVFSGIENVTGKEQSKPVVHPKAKHKTKPRKAKRRRRASRRSATSHKSVRRIGR